MEIDNQVSGIVQNIVSEITTKVQAQVAQQIDAKISEVLSTLDAAGIMASVLGQKLDARMRNLPIDSKSIETVLTAKVDRLAETLFESVQAQAMSQITDSVNAHVNTLDFQTLCQAALTHAIETQAFSYPESSIPASALNVTDWQISGDLINGGIVTDFGSTGIDDKATNCQVTIFDEMTVVENNLLTKDLTVKGTATIEGDLVVTGHVSADSPMYINMVSDVTASVQSEINHALFDSYAGIIADKIRTDGIDLTKITVNGQEVLNGSTLGNHITFSNLQKLGQLRELQVQGETLLSATLYTTSQRVGINTIEPSQALSIWDQEIEVGIGKQSNNTAVIGTPRQQQLVLSSNGKNNITLHTDGSVTVDRLNIGSTVLTASNKPPSNDQPQGTIVFNSAPTLGGPLGWVSLGSARWANFGIVD